VLKAESRPAGVHFRALKTLRKALLRVNPQRAEAPRVNPLSIALTQTVYFAM